MEPALSLTILKFPHFFPASLQAKTAGISKSLMIWLVPSFKLKTEHLYMSNSKNRIFNWTGQNSKHITSNLATVLTKPINQEVFLSKLAVLAS